MNDDTLFNIDDQVMANGGQRKVAFKLGCIIDMPCAGRENLDHDNRVWHLDIFVRLARAAIY